MLTPEQITTDLIGTPESHPFRHLMVEVVRKVMAEVRKDDEALIRQMLEALETGREAATQVAAEFHTSYKGHRPDTHAALDADVDQIAKALAAARARLEKAP